MHKHTMTFQDFNVPPREHTIDLYFNLTEAEITKMQIASNFGLQKDLEEATQNGDNKKLLDFMEYLVHRAYGLKSEDGIRFRKSDEIMEEFEQSAYYSDLYMSLFQEEGAVGVRFINALLPADLIRKAEANARGEGELDQRAAAATAFQKDSRTIFEESRAGLQDHQPKQAVSEPIVVEEAPSERYVSQNQPSYPRVAERSSEEEAEFLAWKASRGAEVPQTRAELRQGQPTEVPEGIGGVISRPPHESGPGFEVSE